MSVSTAPATWSSPKARAASGKQARQTAPRSVHATWHPAADRPDPVTVLEAQNERREPDLVPVRHGRMMASPFTFYRGAAAVMASDLQSLPRAELHVQLCGDAHLSNFGLYASPERALLFDLNDFDETLPGPFEFDVVRLGASFVVAARNNGFSRDRCREAVTAAIAAYRTAMREFASMRTLDVWYARIDAEEILHAMLETGTEAQRARAGAMDKTLRKARSRGSMHALGKLTEVVDGRRRIIHDPPVVVPSRVLRELGYDADEIEALVRDQLAAYRATLQDDRRRLLERFELVDVARKVVGVGSVGTRAYIVLLIGRDADDPLFLQVKEAGPSVLERHLPPSAYATPGERVVHGQRLMQAASDIMLGWTCGVQAGRYYYWRQLRDMKGSATIERLAPSGLEWYAGVCGWTLARAHARSGDPIAIASYLGSSDRFDRAMATCCERFADQNERDHEAFVRAVHAGRLEAVEGV
jgi:uncharacterized protein (DUF2252 family)